MAAQAIGVVFDVESREVGGVVTVHGADLGEASEDLDVVPELCENFVGFGVGWYGCDFSECPSKAGFPALFSPLF